MRFTIVLMGTVIICSMALLAPINMLGSILLAISGVALLNYIVYNEEE